RVSHQPPEQLLRLDVALPFRSRCVDFTVKRQQAGRQFGRRIGERDGSAEGAAIADRRMADVRHGARDEWRMPGNYVGALGLGMARECTDFDGSTFLGNSAEAIKTVDIDQESRGR